MNHALDRLAGEMDLDAAAHERLRLEFGYACVLRVKHLLEEQRAQDCLAGLGAYLEGAISSARYDELRVEAARLANAHQGSKSLDGCGHAAVSASYAVAKALAGKAREAADYAAYALVYGQGGYGAIAERGSFEPEFSWQANCLQALASRQQAAQRSIP